MLGATPPNTRRLKAPTATHTATASTTHRRGWERRSRPLQTKRSGATTRLPMASPSHQVRQALPNVAAGIMPPSQPLVTPTVALTTVLSMAASTTRPRTSRRRSRAGLNPTRRWRSRAPTSASSVFPMAIPHATGTGAPAHRLTRKAPTAIPGQRPQPPRTRAIKAMPVGGQTAVATLCTASKESPNFAVAT